MIDNVSQFFGTVASSELARAARHSARAVWNAHRDAFETTRVEAGKVITLAIAQGRKLARPAKAASAARKSTRRSMRRTTRRAA